ncbi:MULTISPECIES: hypothetical protein [unclassified Xanthobacter]|uniref:hypothetical protein n=1 Tax=unclassified Xanthobacter TaxID=2623496 RepID=UPI001F3FB682|nr:MULTISPECIES: hypothetical protein [unclassified Xanthobacter]
MEALTPMVHPLPPGSRLLLHVPVFDVGDFNEREAPAGQIAIVGLKRGPDFQYELLIWPASMSGYWTEQEAERDAEVLSPGDPRLPTQSLWDAVFELGKLYTSENVDDVDEVFRVPADNRSHVATLLRAAVAEGRFCDLVDSDGLKMAAKIFSAAGGELKLSYEDANEIAAAAGIAARLGEGGCAPAYEYTPSWGASD